MRVTRFLSKVVRVAACLAVLAWGSTATPAQGKRIVRFEGARPSLEACLSARAAIQAASGLLRAKDPAYRAQLDTAHADVDDALAASVQAVWPMELRRRQRNVGRFLSAAAMRVSLSENPAIVEHLGRVARQVRLAQRNLAKAALLLDGTVPTEKPDLSDDPVVTPPVISPPNEFTWTELSPSADSRVIYVSSSDGDNANDGLSPEHPKATWWSPNGAGSLMRSGYPDWMLLKRGDLWSPTSIDDWIQIQGGRSSSEPMVVSAYGDSTERPLVQRMQARVFGGGEHSHVAIVGIHFERLSESVTSDNFNYSVGISIEPGHGTDFLIEDCLIEKYAIGINVHPGEESYNSISNVRIRGCVVVDSYASQAVHAQGMYMQNVDTIVVEGNVLDHNGWSATIPDAGMTIYNHNVYINGNCTDLTFRQNITSRASAQGMPAGICKLNEDNLYLSNPFGCNVYNSAPVAKIRYNVFIDGANVRGHNMDDGDGAQQGGGGIQASYYGTGPAFAGHTIEIYENILANQVTGTGWGPQGIQPGGPVNGLSIHDNIVYKWGRCLYPSDNMIMSGVNDVTNNVFVVGPAEDARLFISSSNFDSFSAWHFVGNQWYSASTNPWWYVGGLAVSSSDAWIAATGETGGIYAEPSFPDPTRSPASYNATLGGAATLDAFLAEARKQSRLNWRPAYTARQANNYFRAGFGRPAR